LSGSLRRIVTRVSQFGGDQSLDDVEALVVPPDLTAALAKDDAAAAGFAATTPSAKKAILFALKTAKKPETRARRITVAVADGADVGRRRRPGSPLTT
jgi:uncharacterized protein YdeI (YjbR/CyaY-like superfamily)